MAPGEFTLPIYALHKELGGTFETSDHLLQALIAYMSDKEIKAFVEDYRQVHGIVESHARAHFSINENDVAEDFETNKFDICAECQDTYHEDELHKCVIEEEKEAVFFSSRIPMC